MSFVTAFVSAVVPTGVFDGTRTAAGLAAPVIVTYSWRLVKGRDINDWLARRETIIMLFRFALLPWLFLIRRISAGEHGCSISFIISFNLFHLVFITSYASFNYV